MKEYYANIKISWDVCFDAKNKKEAIEYLKEKYLDEHSVKLDDSEIATLYEVKK